MDEVDNTDSELLLETEAPEDVVDDEDQETITFGDEEPEEVEETNAVRQMRERIKELNRENKSLRETTPVAKPKTELRPRPKYEDPQYEWDQEKFDADIDKWLLEKVEYDAQERSVKEEQAKAQVAWQNDLAGYERNKARLAVVGKEEAELEALAKLTQLQQSIIVKHPNNAAIMIALGKYPKKLDTVSGISDPVTFAYAIGDIGRELKVTARKKAPEPDIPIRGSAPLSGASTAIQKEKDKIYEQMTKGGDVTKLRARLRQLDSR